MGGDDASSDVIGRCLNDVVRDVDAALAAAALDRARPSSDVDGVAAALRAVAKTCSAVSTKISPALEAAALGCKIDVVAFAGDDARVAEKDAMPAGLESFLRRALCERRSWAKPGDEVDEPASPRSEGDAEALASARSVERRLKKVAFKAAAGGAYVAVDARDADGSALPSEFLAAVTVSACRIHYAARLPGVRT